MTKLSLLTAVAALTVPAGTTTAFVPSAVSQWQSAGVTTPVAFTGRHAGGSTARVAVAAVAGVGALRAESESSGSSSEAVFVPDEEAPKNAEVDDDALAKAESLGKGAAKKKRGKRKGGAAASSNTKAAATLAPEEVFYEGPPAITETIAPTVSILTVVGIIPAAAAWARQAWVRYKITNRRIRVTSGVGGNEMAEIVYPDIVELRTAKRLFGDGDLVAFLRDGAKFEMRNIPEFEETIEFILKQVDKDVADAYRQKGDVTNP